MGDVVQPGSDDTFIVQVDGATFGVFEGNTPFVELEAEVDAVVRGFASHALHSGMWGWTTLLLP